MASSSAVQALGSTSSRLAHLSGLSGLTVDCTKIAKSATTRAPKARRSGASLGRRGHSAVASQSRCGASPRKRTSPRTLRIFEGCGGMPSLKKIRAPSARSARKAERPRRPTCPRLGCARQASSHAASGCAVRRDESRRSEGDARVCGPRTLQQPSVRPRTSRLQTPWCQCDRHSAIPMKISVRTKRKGRY